MKKMNKGKKQTDRYFFFFFFFSTFSTFLPFFFSFSSVLHSLPTLKELDLSLSQSCCIRLLSKPGAAPHLHWFTGADFFPFFSLFSSAVFCYAHPFYASFKAVKAKDSDLINRLMVHWTVLAAFQFAEAFADPFLSW